MVQPNPAGDTQARAMTYALREADLSPPTSCTSTPMRPRLRRGTSPRQSIRQSLGETPRPIVTGTKSMTGHLLGGAGALESLATLLALHHRTVPPTINLENPEPDLGVDIATTARELPAGDLAAINNSFGFGGHNVAIAFTNAYATEV